MVFKYKLGFKFKFFFVAKETRHSDSHTSLVWTGVT